MDALIFTQSPRTAKGEPYQSYLHYVPEGSRVVLYNLKTKELKVLTNDFASAFDPCTYWDGKKFAFAGVHKKGGGCQIWEMNVDGSGLRQLTDYKGTCRAPIYYAAGSIEEGQGRIIWRDRYFDGDWKERGTVEKTGFIIFAGSPDGVMDEFHNPYAYNLFRLDTQGGHVTERITGHVLSGIEFPRINTTIDVDDDPHVADLVQKLLEGESYSIEAATDGETAFALIARQRPDAILLDLIMPGLDGFGLLDQLKQHPEYRTIPIVMLTAKALTAYETVLLQQNVVTILHKRGLDRDALIQELKSAVEVRSSQDARG